MDPRRWILAALVILVPWLRAASADVPFGTYHFAFLDYDFFGESELIDPLSNLHACDSLEGIDLCLDLDMVADASGKYVGQATFTFSGLVSGRLTGPATGMARCAFITVQVVGATLCSGVSFAIKEATGVLRVQGFSLPSRVGLSVSGKVFSGLLFEGTGSVRICITDTITNPNRPRETCDSGGGFFEATAESLIWSLTLDLLAPQGGKLPATATSSLGFDFAGTGTYTASKDSSKVDLTSVTAEKQKATVTLEGLQVDGPEILEFVARYSVLGNTGTVTLWDPEGGPTIFSRCGSEQLKAASKLCSAGFACWSKQAGKPGQDPAVRAACLAKAEASFGGAYAKALANAQKKGGVCVLDDPAGSVSGGVLNEIEAVANAVLGGTDPANSPDNALRSGLLKLSGTLCGADLTALGANAAKPDRPKRDDALAKAEAKFEAAAEKLVDKARKGGVDYDGIPLEMLVDETLGIALGLEAGTADLVPFTIPRRSVTWTGCKDPDDDGIYPFEGRVELTGTGAGTLAATFAVSVADGRFFQFGSLRGSIAPGGAATAEATYTAFDHTGRFDSSGTATCTGAIDAAGGQLRCTGRDLKGDTCAFDTTFPLVP